MKRWFIFRCRPGFEIKAATELKRAGAESYCPQVKKRLHGRPKGAGGRTAIRYTWRPLFIGYVLVEAEPYRLGGLSECDYVHKALTLSGTDIPAPVPVGLVEAIKATEEAERVRADADRNRHRFKPGDKVVAQIGDWGKLAGTIYRLDSRGGIKLIIRLLGSERVADVPPDALLELQAAE